jgi:hypothetical protein
LAPVRGYLLHSRHLGSFPAYFQFIKSSSGDIGVNEARGADGGYGDYLINGIKEDLRFVKNFREYREKTRS